MGTSVVGLPLENGNPNLFAPEDEQKPVVPPPPPIVLLSVSSTAPRKCLSIRGLPEDVYRIPKGGGHLVHDADLQEQWDKVRVGVMLKWRDKPLAQCIVRVDIRGREHSLNPFRLASSTLLLLQAAGVIESTGPACVAGCAVRSRWSTESRVDVTLWNLKK